MKVIDNISELFGDDLKQSLEPNIKLKVAEVTFTPLILNESNRQHIRTFWR